jgi:hypothetical protein
MSFVTFDEHGGLHEVASLETLRMTLAACEYFRAFFSAFVDV